MATINTSDLWPCRLQKSDAIFVVRRVTLLRGWNLKNIKEPNLSKVPLKNVKYIRSLLSFHTNFYLWTMWKLNSFLIEGSEGDGRRRAVKLREEGRGEEQSNFDCQIILFRIPLHATNVFLVTPLKSFVQLFPIPWTLNLRSHFGSWISVLYGNMMFHWRYRSQTPFQAWK